MRKALIFVIMASLCLALSSCGISPDKSNDSLDSYTTNPPAETQHTTDAGNNNQDTTPHATEPEISYFQSDVIVNDFFSRYNAIARNAIEVELIKKGNIKTKALVYSNSFSMEVINVNNSELSISIETTPENEDSIMLVVFQDCIKAMLNCSDNEIANAWTAIHATGYMVENYNFNGISITYVPSKELSGGVNNPRIDLTIPLK